ncbi:pyrroline-5-carboxylate reductase [Allosphingosinicella vermicomposti]|uniref:pyrroline-5-carboxylate reductase n=1 Tax=Allosphingosinicella vermicomposti TaxID=614671 RepID=UPI000D1079A5|nr:pyrroline-5-carboxylate reductase [Allosphingosinicella vermicomposti]
MNPPPLPGPFWLIGCGNMAGAMLDGWMNAGLDPARITVVRPSGKDVGHGIRVLTALPEDEVPALALLGVKPQKLGEVAPLLGPVLEPQTILISILAGTRLATLHSLFPKPRTIIRAMPNTPVRVHKGATGLVSGSADENDRALVEALMTSLGAAEWVADEAVFDLVTALSGSGPAFLYRFIDALGQAAAELGLPDDQARRLALATVEGAAALAGERLETPAILANRVAAPGGSTRAGLDILDREDGLVALLKETLEASVQRNRELAVMTQAS